jgi:hypothetical protein
MVPRCSHPELLVHLDGQTGALQNMEEVDLIIYLV